MTRNEALEIAFELARQRDRENKSSRWLFDRLEEILAPDGGSFFDEAEIWEMVDSL